MCPSGRTAAETSRRNTPDSSPVSTETGTGRGSSREAAVVCTSYCRECAMHRSSLAATITQGRVSPAAVLTASIMTRAARKLSLLLASNTKAATSHLARLGMALVCASVLLPAGAARLSSRLVINSVTTSSGTSVITRLLSRPSSPCTTPTDTRGELPATCCSGLPASALSRLLLPEPRGPNTRQCTVLLAVISFFLSGLRRTHRVSSCGASVPQGLPKPRYSRWDSAVRGSIMHEYLHLSRKASRRSAAP
mmetsp:Transcript_36210/g.80570  ORF Transcript_36210/g.80570 Transcript_36210/m.80570 type:complete len:251 (-) Transcript_36210:1164-1916(-)